MSEGRTLQYLRQLEGLSDKAYVDATGKSIGYGHFIKSGEENLLGARLTKDQSEALLLKDARDLGTAGRSTLKVKISENQKIALDLLAYNAGPGAAQSIAKLLNEGKTQEAAEKFKVFNKSRDGKGKPLTINPVLVARRDYERKLFLTPDSEKFTEVFKGAPAGKGSSNVTSTTTETIINSTASPFPTVDGSVQLSENQRILAELQMLNQALNSTQGMDAFNNEALNRIRIEGGGRAA